MFPSTSSGETLRLSGKQNSLFPSGAHIKGILFFCSDVIKFLRSRVESGTIRGQQPELRELRVLIAVVFYITHENMHDSYKILLLKHDRYRIQLNKKTYISFISFGNISEEP